MQNSLVEKDRTLAAAAMILTYAIIIGFTDNFVPVIAKDAGLWQFHATRSLMALVLLGGAGLAFGYRLRPKNWRAVTARSLIHGAGIMIYFGALAFLPVAVVAAGLFTAPIFVLLISRFAFGQSVAWVQILAVAIGFCGVILVLGPRALSGTSLAAILPILAGLLYALGNIATRRWCAEESAQTLLAGFFVGLGLFGVLGMIVLGLLGHVPPLGTDGFIERGAVWADSAFYFWTFIQAAGSLIGVGFMIRAYQITHVSRAAVLEYVILPASAFWSYVIWGQTLGVMAISGMVLIAVAGAIISLSDRRI